MADDKNIAFELEVKGAEQSINSVKELKKAIQAAKDEQLKAAEAFGVGSKEFTKASQAVADLKDKVEDLADATESVKGSGVESIGKSFSQLKEGFSNFDTDKIKTGFKGIGAAMSAIPILLLIEGLKYLIENFDEVSQSVKKFFNIASDAEKNIKALEKATSELKKTNEGLVSSLENEIKILEAQGNSQEKVLSLRKRIIAEKIKEAELDIQLQKAKIAEILSNDSLIESYYRVAAASARSLGKEKEAAILEAVLAKEKNERIKESSDLLKADLITIQNLKTDAQVADIKRENEITADYKKQNDAKLESDKAYYAEKNRQALENEKSLNEALKSLSEVQRTERLEANKEEGDLKLQQIDAVRTQEYEDHVKFEKEKQQATFDITQKSVEGAMALSDLYFAYKKNGLKKGSAEELAFAKKQFEVNKGLAIASAGIQGIQTVMAAYASGVATPIIGAATGPVYAALAGIVVAANIAKLASAKFDGGTGGAGSAASPSLPSAPSIPPPPSISTQANNTNQNTLFDDEGKRIGGDPSKRMAVNVTATVGVNEIAEKSNRVQVLENQSTF